MRKPKFKVGDKVKVMRASTKKERDLWGDSWMPDMDKAIGKVFLISYVLSDDYQEEYEYCKYELVEGGYVYPEFVLQKVNEVGKQLLFEFME